MPKSWSQTSLNCRCDTSVICLKGHECDDEDFFSVPTLVSELNYRSTSLLRTSCSITSVEGSICTIWISLSSLPSEYKLNPPNSWRFWRNRSLIRSWSGDQHAGVKRWDPVVETIPIPSCRLYLVLRHSLRHFRAICSTMVIIKWYVNQHVRIRTPPTHSILGMLPWLHDAGSLTHRVVYCIYASLTTTWADATLQPTHHLSK